MLSCYRNVILPAAANVDDDANSQVLPAVVVVAEVQLDLSRVAKEDAWTLTSITKCRQQEEKEYYCQWFHPHFWYPDQWVTHTQLTTKQWDLAPPYDDVAYMERYLATILPTASYNPSKKRPKRYYAAHKRPSRKKKQETPVSPPNLAVPAPVAMHVEPTTQQEVVPSAVPSEEQGRQTTEASCN